MPRLCEVVQVELNNVTQVWARQRWRVSKVVTAWVTRMGLVNTAKTLSFKCGAKLLR